MENKIRMSDGHEPPYSQFVYEPLAPEIENQFVESVLVKIIEAKSQNKKALIPMAFEDRIRMDPYSYKELSHSHYLENLLKALPQPNPEDFPQSEEELKILSKSRKALLERIGLLDGKLEIVHEIERNRIGMGREFHHCGKTNMGDTVYYHKISNNYDDWYTSALDFFTINISEAELKYIIKQSNS